MKLEKQGLLESIKKLNKEKPLKEGKELQRVLAPADADAVEQHEEALEANKKRLDPKNYEKEIKDLIKETASEESRYAHFDVVDRKDLAKKINEAKEKGLEFKISRSMKEGFRYDFKVLKEEFVKKDAGDPEVNKDAFNKSTDVGSPVCEAVESDTCELLTEVSGRSDLREALNCLDDEHFFLLSDAITATSGSRPHSEYPLDENLKLRENNSNIARLRKLMLGEEVEDKEETLGEELKVYTSSLDNFHPSKQAEELWDEIKDSKKVEDLEYALETLYPDGIADEALDDMLIHEEDWIRDLIGLPLEDDELEEPEEEPIDEFEDDEVEPVEGDEDLDYNEEPIYDEEVTEEESEEPAKDEKELKVDDEVEEEPKKVKKEEIEVIESLNKKPEENKTEVIEDKEEDDDNLSKLAEGFVNSQYKENNGETLNTSQDQEVKEAIKSSEDDDEIVAVDDSMVEDMLGMPKEEKK